MKYLDALLFMNSICYVTIKIIYVDKTILKIKRKSRFAEVVAEDLPNIKYHGTMFASSMAST